MQPPTSAATVACANQAVSTSAVSSTAHGSSSHTPRTQIRTYDIQLYAAGLVGNLAGHTATSAVIAGVKGVGRELVRQLREALTAPSGRPDPEAPATEPLLGEACGREVGGRCFRSELTTWVAKVWVRPLLHLQAAYGMQSGVCCVT